MAELSYLSGKVRKLSLPTYSGPAPNDAPVHKRMLLPQGELSQFYDADVGMRYIAFIELRPGTVRGNHYHKTKEEFIYVLRGKLLLVLEDIESKERMELEMDVGARAQISTGVAHTLRILDAGEAVEFSKTQFNPTDVYRYPLE